MRGRVSSSPRRWLQLPERTALPLLLIMTLLLRLPVQNTAPVRLHSKVVKTEIRRVVLAIVVQEIDPGTVLRQRNIDKLKSIRKIQYDHVEVAAGPSMKNRDLPGLIDPVAIRRKPRPRRVIIIRIKVSGRPCRVRFA